MSLALAGCGTSSDGPLRVAGQMPPDHWVLEGFGRVEPDVPLSMGSIILCLDRPGDVTITDVAPLHPVGTITVQTFAVRPSPFMRTPPGLALGDDIGPLGKFGFHGNHVVPIVCDSRKGAGYELGLQITKPTRRPAAAAGWIVTYTSHGKLYHVQVPPEVKLCSEESADEGACGRITHESLTSG